MTLDEIKERMKIAMGDAALAHLAKHIKSGGQPMTKEGEFISWSDWISERFYAADQHLTGPGKPGSRNVL